VSTPSNPETLRWSDLLLLLLLALVVDLFLVSLQPVPGYMDAAYYYATGIQLAKGHGFNEPFIWNYLDQPQTLPHPSNAYWYPLASMVAAIGMTMTGRIDFLSARMGFLLAALLLPLAVTSLAWRITKKRDLALISGVLTIFCGYYLPFISTTDNYALYMLLGTVFFLLLDKMSHGRALLLGLLAGCLNLARADGLLWLPLTLFAVTLLAYQKVKNESFRIRFLFSITTGGTAAVGYLLVMGFWFLRNLRVFGTLTPPGSAYVLWMTNYNQIYSYTPEIYTFASWLSVGWKEILSARLLSLWKNLGTAIMAQGSVLLFPFILLGGWKNRRLSVVQYAFFGWLILLLTESVLFPFASVRGGFFHAGAAFQPVWFILAPVGLDLLLVTLPKSVKGIQFRRFIHLVLIMIVIVLSVMLVKIRVLDSGWNEGEYRYEQAEEILAEYGISPEDVVMVVNPPAYNAMTSQQAVVIPDGDLKTLLSAAAKFNADYLILERDHLPDCCLDLYLHPEAFPGFIDIGGFDDVRIFFIEHSP
jgi:hypothetical protein